MDVTALLNASSSLPATKRARSSESPAITHGGHTAPSSVLPTPSPDRILAPSESEKGKASNGLWGSVDYPLHISVESKLAPGSVFFHPLDRKTESEPSYDTHSTQYSRSRNSSVSSRANSTRSTSRSPKMSSSNTYWSKTDSKAPSPTMHRPMSPSDTVLQIKGQGSSINAEERLATSQGRTVPTKMHKRTMSAPDIAQISVARIPHQQRHTVPRTSETIAEAATETLPDHARHRAGASPETSTNPAAELEKEAYCMFVKDCDTGSQLRKAISHLFGRNKACTLRIPKHVWVYYCRKHYQRIRYRNAKTYPLNQMELVKLQIIRLQEWSDENQKQQTGPHIKQWALSLRKREQSRIENGGGMDELHSDGRNAAGTAVPEWLIQRVGSGYTTEEIMDVASRLHAEIKDGVLSQVPEVEFLPDIVDGDSASTTKTVRTRKQSRPSNGPRTPKRKAPETLELCRRSSNFSEGQYGEYHHGGETYEVVSPSGKRARVIRVPPPLPRGSSQLPPLASALSGAEMHPPPGPPRAPNVVPRIQPIEYRRGSVQGGLPPPPRRESYDSHPHSAYSVQSSPGDYWYGSGSSSSGGYSMAPPQTLPPISAQLESRFPRQPAHGAPDHHYARPTHVRSASAYVPADKPWPGASRPSSSGSEMPAPYADHHRYEPTAHETGPHHGAREYEQGYSYGWSGHHQGHPPQAAPMHGAPSGYVPRHAAPQTYTTGHQHQHQAQSWGRYPRPVYARDRP